MLYVSACTKQSKSAAMIAVKTVTLTVKLSAPLHNTVALVYVLQLTRVLSPVVCIGSNQSL